MNSLMVTYVIALYIRLSIEDSKVESLSIENQKNALHKYVDTMEGVRNVEVLEFIDNGYSGTNFERPAIQELLELVRAGKNQLYHCQGFFPFWPQQYRSRLLYGARVPPLWNPFSVPQ